jgi:hypothetical protein
VARVSFSRIASMTPSEARSQQAVQQEKNDP